MCRDMAPIVPMARVLHAHKTMCTAETIDAYGQTMMCNDVHMRKQLTWISTHSTADTHGTTRVPKIICMFNM